MDAAHLVVHSSSVTREAFYVAMTRGRFSNVAYVATNEAHLEEHQHTPGHDDGEVTARTILYGVLQHEGAEKSAHETIEAEQEKWSSITQLAAEYETIAQAAQHQRFTTTTVATSDLAGEQARQSDKMAAAFREPSLLPWQRVWRTVVQGLDGPGRALVDVGLAAVAGHAVRW